LGTGRAPFIERHVARLNDDARPRTLSKEPMLANRRLAFNRTRDRDVVSKLLKELAPRYQARPGGYTRTTKVRFGIGQQRADGFRRTRRSARTGHRRSEG
jgi:ribosomal protein L17